MNRNPKVRRFASQRSSHAVRVWRRALGLVYSLLKLAALALAVWVLSRCLPQPDRAPHSSTQADSRGTPAPQPREHNQRVEVRAELLRLSDGDTAVIVWSKSDREHVRILGIDAPELRNLEREIYDDQPFGPEAREFARQAFEKAGRVELLRAATLDDHGRTLGYFFLDGQNYSVQLIRAGLAAETVSAFGDNGFPQEAAAVLEAARRAPALKFEPPHKFRARMRARAAQNRQNEHTRPAPSRSSVPEPPNGGILHPRLQR